MKLFHALNTQRLQLENSAENHVQQQFVSYQQRFSHVYGSELQARQVAELEASQKSHFEEASHQLQLALSQEQSICSQQFQDARVLRSEVDSWATEARQVASRNTTLCSEMSQASVRYDNLENEVQNITSSMMSCQSRCSILAQESASNSMRAEILAEDNA